MDWVRVVWGWFVRWEVSLSIILDISNITTIVISMIVNNLGATIRKGNSVGAAHNIAVRVLSLGKVGTRVLIMHSILISVGLWGLVIDWGGMVWGWWADWGGRGNSGQEGSGGNHGFVHVG